MATGGTGGRKRDELAVRGRHHLHARSRSLGVTRARSRFGPGARCSPAAADHRRGPHDELVERCQQEWCNGKSGSSVEILAVANRSRVARDPASTPPFCSLDPRSSVFLDDDAEAAPDWLERVLTVYATRPKPSPLAVRRCQTMKRPRPGWFPPEFDWVLGCHYQSMPDQLGPTNRLIGTSLSGRREAILDIGGWPPRRSRRHGPVRTDRTPVRSGIGPVRTAGRSSSFRVLGTAHVVLLLAPLLLHQPT